MWYPKANHWGRKYEHPRSLISPQPPPSPPQLIQEINFLLPSPSVTSDIFPIGPRNKAAHTIDLLPFFSLGSHLLWLVRPWKRQCFCSGYGKPMFLERCPAGTDFEKGFVTYALEYQWSWSWSYDVFHAVSSFGLSPSLFPSRGLPEESGNSLSVILFLSWSSPTSPTTKKQIFSSFSQNSKTTVRTNPPTTRWRRSTFGVSRKPVHTATTPRIRV